MAKLKLLIAAIGIITVLFGGSRAGAEENFPETNVHRVLASKESGWLNTARALTAEDLKGRIILLDFWTYCCINCMHVIPDLQYLEKKFGDKLTVIGVHSAKFENEKDSSNIRNAMLRYGIHHPVINDYDFDIWSAFGARAWPTFMLINPLGKLEVTYSGEGHREALEEHIENLIEEYDGKFKQTALPIALEESKIAPSILSFPGKLEALNRPDDEEEPMFFVSDGGNHRVLKVGVSGKIHAIIGSGKEGFKDGDKKEAEFRRPQGVAYDSKRNKLYVADTGNHSLREVDLETGEVFTLAGNGKQGFDRTVQNSPARRVSLASPWDIELYPDQNTLVIAMAGTHQLWKLDLNRKLLSVLAGNGRESIDDGAYPMNSLSQPSDVSALYEKLYFVDSETSSLRVLEEGNITTLIGTGLFDFGFVDGKQGIAQMQHAIGLFADEENILIADSYNHAIRRYDAEKGILSTTAGNGTAGAQDGSFESARFNEPNDIIRIGNKYYVTDTNNHLIRILDMKEKTVSTLSIIAEEEMVMPTLPVEHLPNKMELKEVKVASGKVVDVMLNLPDGWKVNDEAPSWLNLFVEGKEGGYTLLKGFDTKSLKTKKAVLPALEETKHYRLQGTIYHCEEKAGSICLIKSIDTLFKPEKGAEGSQITIELTAPLP